MAVLDKAKEREGRTTAVLLDTFGYRDEIERLEFIVPARFVTDFAEDTVHTALAGGPSDRVRSPWYASDFDGWRDGRLKRVRP